MLNFSFLLQKNEIHRTKSFDMRKQSFKFSLVDTEEKLKLMTIYEENSRKPTKN